MQTYNWQQAVLSATVTLSTLSWQQGRMWTGALNSCYGPVNVFTFGDPSQLAPSGVAGNNLVADPFFTLPLGVEWSQPDPNWFISGNAGLHHTNALTAASADSGSVKWSLSAPIPVTAGQKYRASCFINATATTSGTLAFNVCNEATSVDYLSIPATNGTAQNYSGSFTVPAGVTSVYLQCVNDGAVFPANSNVSFSYLTLTASSPQVNGANQSGYSLITNGWEPNTNDLLLAGDYISIVSAPVNAGDMSIPRLYSVTQPVSSDGSGNATLSIFPPIREIPANGTSINLSNTQGLFRLVNNQQKWNTSHNQTTSLSFSIVEAL